MKNRKLTFLVSMLIGIAIFFSGYYVGGLGHGQPPIAYANYLRFEEGIQVPASGPFVAELAFDAKGARSGWKATLKYGDRDVVWRTLDLPYVGRPELHFAGKQVAGHYSVSDPGKFDIMPKKIFLLSGEDLTTINEVEADGLDNLQRNGINKAAAWKADEIDRYMNDQS